MTTSHEQHEARHPTFKQYVLVAVILFAITIVEFALIYDRIGIDWDSSDALASTKVPLLIGLSAIKFGTVIMFYMHLKFDSRLLTGIFLAGLGLAFAVGIALLALFVTFRGEPRDFAEAHALPYEEQGEEGEHADEAAPGSTKPSGGETPVAGVLQIGVVGDTLQFDADSLKASAGSEVVFTFSNGSAINQHNWVLVPVGTKDAVAAAGALAGPGNDWIQPDDARVLFHTRLLDPGESQEIRFTVDAGTYQFVCTFPGHNLTMFGDFEVTEGREESTAQAVAAAPSASGSVNIGVEGDALKFNTGSLASSAGSEVVLTFSNGSAINQHNWVLVQAGTKDAVATAGVAAGPGNDWISPGDDRVLFHTRLLNPGESEEIRFTLDAGTYQFVCTFPGHNLTMFGDFEVTS